MPLQYRYLAKAVSRSGRVTYRYPRQPGVVVPFRPRQGAYGFNPQRSSWYAERFAREALKQGPGR